MRHYEIVLLLHPDYNDQIKKITNYYISMIVNSGGTVHRIENWGRRQLAYSIKKLNKAYYILLNVEISQIILNELNNDFKFNDIVLRNLIMRTKYAITGLSPMMNKKEENKDHNIIELN